MIGRLDPMWDREWMSPRNGDRGRWYMPTEEIYLETVQTLEQEYKTPILWSPSHIGIETLRTIHKDQAKRIEPLPYYQRMDFQQRARSMCNWIAWSKWTDRKPGLSEDQKQKRFVVGYDKNAQFLGAAQSVELGNGGYEEIDFEPEYAAYPGFWQYELLDVSGSLFNGSDLPCPLDRVKGVVSSDLLLCCLNFGLKIAVRKGIYWKECDHYLSKWAKDMWQHRANMKKVEDAIVRRNCEGTAKHIPNSVVGRFANELSGEYYHPDWNRLIVHCAVTNMVYTLQKIKRDHDCSPILVSKDALYFATDYESILAIPGMLDHQYEQRGWKPIGVCSMTNEIEATFEIGKVGEIEQCIKQEMKHGTTTTI
jgi:hypothetical protein